MLFLPKFSKQLNLGLNQTLYNVQVPLLSESTDEFQILDYLKLTISSYLRVCEHFKSGSQSHIPSLDEIFDWDFEMLPELIVDNRQQQVH